MYINYCNVNMWKVDSAFEEVTQAKGILQKYPNASIKMVRINSGKWFTLSNLKVYTVHLIIQSSNSRVLRWVRMGEDRNALLVLIGKPEGNIPLGNTLA